MNQNPLPGPVAALFPRDAERNRIEECGSPASCGAPCRARAFKQAPSRRRSTWRPFAPELENYDFSRPLPLEDLLHWTMERMQHGIVQMANPRYFGLFNPGPNFPAQCADRISGLFNPQLASSGSSPVPVELEKHVIRAIARRAGCGEEATGHFATGGSEANYTALLCALTGAHPGFAGDGVRAFCGSGEILYVATIAISPG